ncbi:hypothetical protein HY227_00215 [Candidatus Wolfebacteria bacterium]|nr:hypothetical protein [Candidatus Wolfebacteria bacterium]
MLSKVLIADPAEDKDVIREAVKMGYYVHVPEKNLVEIYKENSPTIVPAERAEVFVRKGLWEQVETICFGGGLDHERKVLEAIIEKKLYVCMFPAHAETYRVKDKGLLFLWDEHHPREYDTE